MIETINLTKRYGELVALDNLNLSIEEGDCYGFIGPNGAGKTTTIKILATLLKPSSGQAQVAGMTVDVDPSTMHLGADPVGGVAVDDDFAAAHLGPQMHANVSVDPNAARLKFRTDQFYVRAVAFPYDFLVLGCRSRDVKELGKRHLLVSILDQRRSNLIGRL